MATESSLVYSQVSQTQSVARFCTIILGYKQTFFPLLFAHNSFVYSPVLHFVFLVYAPKDIFKVEYLTHCLSYLLTDSWRECLTLLGAVYRTQDHRRAHLGLIF